VEAVVETGITEPLVARWRFVQHGQGPEDHASRDRRLQQRGTDPLAQNPDDANGNPRPGTFMEWAVGKQGEVMRPTAAS
jgi:hypothetical protein